MLELCCGTSEEVFDNKLRRARQQNEQDQRNRQQHIKRAEQLDTSSNTGNRRDRINNNKSHDNCQLRRIVVGNITQLGEAKTDLQTEKTNGADCT